MKNSVTWGKIWGFTKGLDAPFPSAPEIMGRDGGIPYQAHFGPIFSPEALNTWVEDLGGVHDCLDSPCQNLPKFSDKDAERETYYWKWLCPFLDDVLNDTGEDLEVHDGGCPIPNLPHPGTREWTLQYVTGKGSASS